MKIMIMDSKSGYKAGERFNVTEVTKEGYKVKTKSGIVVIPKKGCAVIEN